MSREKFEIKPPTFATEQDWLNEVERLQQEVEEAKARKIAAQGPAEYGPAIRALDAKEKELQGLMYGRVVITSPSKETIEKALQIAEQNLMSAKDEASHHRAVQEIEAFRLRLSDIND